MIDRTNETVNILVNEQMPSKEFNLYEVGFEKCKPSKPSEYIPIDYWVLHYCTSGEGYFSTSTMSEQHITAGDLFLIPANLPNMYFPKKENPWTYQWIGFSGEKVEAILRDIHLTPNKCVLKNAFDVMITNFFSAIYTAVREKQPYLALSNSFSLLDYLVQNYTSTQEKNQSKQLFLNIIHFIDQHYSQNLTITKIAELHNIDRTYLFKLFKRYKKITPSVYIQQLKLQQACLLLKKSSLTITDISYEVGFSSPSYFSKVFVTNLKMTPFHYRNQFIAKTTDPIIKDTNRIRL